MKFEFCLVLFYLIFSIESQAYHNPQLPPSTTHHILPPQFKYQQATQQFYQIQQQQQQQESLPSLTSVNYPYHLYNQFYSKKNDAQFYPNYPSFNYHPQFQPHQVAQTYNQRFHRPATQSQYQPQHQSLPQQHTQNRQGFFKVESEEVPNKLAQCGYLRPRITKYVSNGESTSHNLWPWYVQIKISSDSNPNEASETYCGGTLISHNYIVTAAHCYDELEESLRARNTMITMRGVEPLTKTSRTKKKKLKKSKDSILHFKAVDVVLHNEYIPAMSDRDAALKRVLPGPKHDIALIKFDAGEHEVSDKLMPACLPAKGHQISIGTKCKIMGHGFMNSNDEENFIMPNLLQMADVSISANAACKNDVDSESIKQKISADTVCIRGPIHPCVGDSGGPLLCKGESSNVIKGEKTDEEDNSSNEDEDPTKARWYLVGVTSFAVSTDENDKCGHFKSAVFGKISSYIDWINKIIKN